MKHALLWGSIAIATLTLTGLVLAGCGPKNIKAGTPAANQPVNNFEKYAYEVLSDVQTGLAETDSKIKAGELPKSVIADYDRAAVLYNTLRDLLNRYDQTYRAGGDPGSLQVEINGDLADLLSLAYKLFPNKMPKPVPAPAVK